MKQTSKCKMAALGVVIFALSVLIGDGTVIVAAIVVAISWAFEKNLPTIYRRIKNHAWRRAIYDALKED